MTSQKDNKNYKPNSKFENKNQYGSDKKYFNKKKEYYNKNNKYKSKHSYDYQKHQTTTYEDNKNIKAQNQHNTHKKDNQYSEQKNQYHQNFEKNKNFHKKYLNKNKSNYYQKDQYKKFEQKNETLNKFENKNQYGPDKNYFNKKDKNQYYQNKKNYQGKFNKYKQYQHNDDKKDIFTLDEKNKYFNKNKKKLIFVKQDKNTFKQFIEFVKQVQTAKAKGQKYPDILLKEEPSVAIKIKASRKMYAKALEIYKEKFFNPKKASKNDGILKVIKIIRPKKLYKNLNKPTRIEKIKYFKKELKKIMPHCKMKGIKIKNILDLKKRINLLIKKRQNHKLLKKLYFKVPPFQKKVKVGIKRDRFKLLKRKNVFNKMLFFRTKLVRKSRKRRGRRRLYRDFYRQLQTFSNNYEHIYLNVSNELLKKKLELKAGRSIIINKELQFNDRQYLFQEYLKKIILSLSILLYFRNLNRNNNKEAIKNVFAMYLLYLKSKSNLELAYIKQIRRRQLEERKISRSLIHINDLSSIFIKNFEQKLYKYNHSFIILSFIKILFKTSRKKLDFKQSYGINFKKYNNYKIKRLIKYKKYLKKLKRIQNNSFIKILKKLNDKIKINSLLKQYLFLRKIKVINTKRFLTNKLQMKIVSKNRKLRIVKKHIQFWVNRIYRIKKKEEFKINNFFKRNKYKYLQARKIKILMKTFSKREKIEDKFLNPYKIRLRLYKEQKSTEFLSQLFKELPVFKQIELYKKFEEETNTLFSYLKNPYALCIEDVKKVPMSFRKIFGIETKPVAKEDRILHLKKNFHETNFAKKHRNKKLGCLYYVSTFRNLKLTFKDMNTGKVLRFFSCGTHRKYKKSRRKHQDIRDKTLFKMTKEIGRLRYKRIALYFKGFYIKPRSMRKVLRRRRIKIVAVFLDDRYPHNGCRLPNRKRK